VHAKATRDLDLEGAQKDPDAWRGEWVRARGIVVEMWAIRLARPVLGRTDVFRGVLSDGEKHFFVDWTEKPPGADFSREAVDVEGIFYRAVSYEGATGERHSNAPLLLVRNVKVVDPAHEGGFSGTIRENMLTIVGTLAFAIFLAALLLSWAQKRGKRTRARAQPATIREMFEKKLREEGRVPPAPQ
jgi:hypothetical protein